MPTPRQRRIWFALLACFVLTLTVAAWLGFRMVRDDGQRQAQSFALAQQRARSVAGRVAAEMTTQEGIARALGGDLASGLLTTATLEARIRADMERHPAMFGLGVAFEPDSFDAHRGLFAPYAHRGDGDEPVLGRLDDTYDYTQDTANSWYHKAAVTGAFWDYTGVIDPVAQTYMVEFYYPFHPSGDAEGRHGPAGVVYAEYSLDTLQAMLRSLDLGDDGYSFLLAPDGTWVAYPDVQAADDGEFGYAGFLMDAKWQQESERARRGESFYVDRPDTLSGLNAWTFYEPLAAEGWAIVIVVDKDILDASPVEATRSQIQLGLAVLASLLLLGAMVIRVGRGTTASLWRAAALAAVVAASGVFWIWHVALSNPLGRQDVTSTDVLANQATVEKSLQETDAMFAKRGLRPPIRVPTGIQVTNIKFEGPDEVKVTGYIWQEYPLGLPKDVERMFALPDDVSLSPSFTEVHRIKEGDREVIGWSFQSVLRQPFRIVTYPLDTETVEIEVWPQALDYDMVLVPDLDAYDFLNPLLKPGIASDLTTKGWRVIRSYFTYQQVHHNVDFGSQKVVRRDSTPNLVFSIDVQRKLVSPIIAYGFTICVVAILAFAMVYFPHDRSSAVLSEASGMIFVVAVAHGSMRASVGGNRVVYLEALLITLYAAILLGGATAILACTKSPARLIAYRDALIPKLVYWPLLMGTYLLITLAIFYPVG